MPSLKLKSLFFVFALAGWLVVPLVTQASSFDVSRNIITVVQGQNFTVPVTINPAGEKSYTARFTLGYPADLLEVTSFTFASSWLPLSQSGYDLIDNSNGQLIKTAGFPQGFSTAQAFGTVTFHTKQAGQAVLTVGPQSFILNAQNQSTLESRPQIQVVINQSLVTPAPAVPLAPLPSLPAEKKNIFDLGLAPSVETNGAGLVSRVAPGEFLPISVRLLNLGNSNKVDVAVSYKIADFAGNVIYTSQETVAVETTANYVKTIQIPYETVPGRYIVSSSIIYQDQVTPATTEFPFTVEPKILGIFQSDFILYVGIMLFVALLVSLLTLALVKRRRQTRGNIFDYSYLPHGERVFYELISDTIMDMRQRAGDQALDIAAHIRGLTIDPKTGRVMRITRSPSKVIAELVSRYENTLGKSVSFAFRNTK